MRRLRDRTPGTLFRAGELPRLATMVVMLGVLLMLIDRARQPDVWRWFAPGDAAEARQDPATGPQQLPQDDVATADAGATGPTDLDADEQDAAREEFQAITDKAPLGKVEMPAYWRLMGWQQHQSIKELRARAHKKVSYRELWDQPEKWRGQLIELPVHINQSARADGLEDNPVGLASVDEVWGWNSDSQPYSYWLVCPELPPGMPSGKNLYEEATFVGYFLKLLPYEDHQGKSRATPLLIGRLVWHPQAANPLARRDEWTWPWIVGGGLFVLYLTWRGLGIFGRRAPVAAPTTRDDQAVATWLEQGEFDDPSAGRPGESTETTPASNIDLTGPPAESQ